MRCYALQKQHFIGQSAPPSSKARGKWFEKCQCLSMRLTTLRMFLAAGCLAMAACNSQQAQPASEQKADVSSTTEPTRNPVAGTPDGSAANTGNRVNGQQVPAGKK
jgi:hypothetical protein